MTSSSKALASTPPMGWNSWNTFGHHVEEALIRETADALKSSGLRDSGYEYIVIDDCWSIKDRRAGHRHPADEPRSSGRQPGPARDSRQARRTA